MIKVGISGQNGFIGWHLYNRLSLSTQKFQLIDFKRDNFNNEILLDDFVSKCDIIVHLAGINRHNESNYIYNKNIELSEKLIESFQRTNFKGQIIFSSSTQEERDNAFGKAKKESREMFANWASNNGCSFKGLIIPNVFGPFGVPYYNSVVSTFCHQLVNDEIPNIEVDSTLKLIYIDELINLIIEQFESNRKEKIIDIQHRVELKVSEILEILCFFKSIYFKNGEIPKLNSAFELNLFNTFRSYFNLNNHFPIKYKNNIDPRGNFVEIIRQGTGGQVSFSTTKKGITRGDHFHTRKIERFSVIKGKAIIKLRKVNSNEIFTYHLSGDEPSYVDMPIWFSHNITNIGEEDLYTMFWINETYNPNEADTFFEVV